MTLVYILAALLVLALCFIEWQMHQNHTKFAAQATADINTAKAKISSLETQVAVLVSHNPTSAPTVSPVPVVPSLVATPTIS